jgi:hypothetical protein
MRWKLLRRRLSISAPRVIVRRHLPWPLRWAVAAVVLGFCGAIGLWAFEFGKDIAGLDRQSKAELAQLRVDTADLRKQRDKAQSLADTADSLLKAERAAQEKLTQQVRQLEADNQALKADLGFFERLLPSDGAEGVSIRSVQVSLVAPGQLRYQLLVMQSGKNLVDFKGRFELALIGTLDGKAWTMPAAGGPHPLAVTRYARTEGLIEFAPGAVVKTVQVRIIDGGGTVRSTHTAKL